MTKKDLEQLAQLFQMNAHSTLTGINSCYAESDEPNFKEITGLTFKQAEKVMGKFLDTLDSFRND